jgi:hypothetical protein
MTPANDLLCALCGEPIPDLRTARVSLNGQRVHPLCAVRHDLDLAPDAAPAEPLPPYCPSLRTTLFVYIAWGTLVGIFVAGILWGVLACVWRVS